MFFTRSWALVIAALIVVGFLFQSGAGDAPTQAALGQDAAGKLKPKSKDTSPQHKAEALGIKFEKLEPKYLNSCVKAGKLLFTSGHTSKIKGRLGKDLTVEEGYKAARESAVEVLRAVWNRHGTLDGLRVVKVLGCVNSDPSFIDQPKVVNGCSDLLHEIFGAKADGWHARSALGFASLPNGCAVEVEAIFEIKE